MYYKNIFDGFIASISIGNGQTQISETEYNNLYNMICLYPSPPEGFTYCLRADNLEWELVALLPAEPEPPTAEEALTRYANELTGADDPDLLSAAETLIKQRTEE